MSTSKKIVLTPQESRELRLTVRRQKSPHREVVRAQMILMLTAGERFAAASRKVRKARRIVYKGAKRFLASRLAGLKSSTSIKLPLIGFRWRKTSPKLYRETKGISLTNSSEHRRRLR